ncbi:trans-activating protein [Hibiscus golden mosaic virus]|uniref:Transcriptional activator protein n=1 Tax=Hibiscus golden mosaic virus TaxID=2569569 RepID=A0A4D6FVF4_9GEMI|nr:trans-activating protein [Hibiscus golden mosaic virus]QCB65768.1 trans-activating protein [Hibiscus golden mosaic virus]
MRLLSRGHSIMQNSSSSTLPSIKRRKKRAVRRRRIDLACGCSIYRHINCVDHGFTHRGTHHCSSGGEWRLYMGGSKSPVFQDVPSRGPEIHKNPGVPHPNTLQPQPEESVASPQGLPELPNLDDISDSFWDDIFK